jgi:predicted hydrolase (HD superfamily)
MLKNLFQCQGKKTKFVKKMKNADEMKFLKPHMKERDSISHIVAVTDDDDNGSLKFFKYS